MLNGCIFYHIFSSGSDKNKVGKEGAGTKLFIDFPMNLVGDNGRLCQTRRWSIQLLKTTRKSSPRFKITSSCVKLPGNNLSSNFGGF